MQKFGRRLRALRRRQGLTQQALAAKLGLSLSSVSHWESGDGVPSPNNLSKIAEILRCTIPFLLGDEEAIFANNDLSNLDEGHLKEKMGNARFEAAPQKVFRVPVVSWAKAGAAQDYADLANQINETVDTACRDPNAFALIIEGDSMEPKFEAGYRVIFSPNSEPRNGDFVVARLSDGFGVLFKRFKRTGTEGQTVRLESLNPAYAPLEYPMSAFKFIYPAVEFRSVLPR